MSRVLEDDQEFAGWREHGLSHAYVIAAVINSEASGNSMAHGQEKAGLRGAGQRSSPSPTFAPSQCWHPIMPSPLSPLYGDSIPRALPPVPSPILPVALRFPTIPTRDHTCLGASNR